MQSRVLPTSLKETRDKDSSLAAALTTAVLRKPGVSESLKETRDKDSSLAAALKRWFWQSRLLPILSKRPEIRIPAWRHLSKRRFCKSRRFRQTRDKDSSLAAALKTAGFNQMPPKSGILYLYKYAKPCASDSLKETRDKDSRLAAALKAMALAKPAASDALKEARDKDSSSAAALKTAVFNQMPPKSATLCLNMQSRALPILSKRLISDSSLAAGLKTAVFNQMLSKSAILCVNMQSRVLPTSQRPETRIPAWRQL